MRKVAFDLPAEPQVILVSEQLVAVTQQKRNVSFQSFSTGQNGSQMWRPRRAQAAVDRGRR